MTSATQSFTLADQIGFATLSGDWNPIHVDPIAARRLLFGEPVVHGVHVVMWAIDRLAAQLTGFGRLNAVFRQPVMLNRPVSLVWTKDAAGAWRGAVACEGRPACTITVTEAAPRPATAPSQTAAPPQAAPTLRTPDELDGLSGALPLALDSGAIAARFPALVQRLDPAGCATLLASTRLVGMECPGLHSLFSELSVDFDDRAAGVSLDWRVAAANPELRIVDLAFSSAGGGGLARAFFRPAAEPQLTMTDAVRRVAPGLYAGRRALVVGGSRGLGEVAAKLLAAGGAETTVTYATGGDDAEAVAAALRSAGAQAETMRCDVIEADHLRFNEFYTHIYYFAAPKIRPGIPGVFDTSLFDLYQRYFVDGFAALAQRVRRPARIFYPSTIYVERPERGFAEYAAAKAAGEALCRYLDVEQDLTVSVTRFDKLRTDQTQALIGAAAAEPADALLPMLST